MDRLEMAFHLSIAAVVAAAVGLASYELFSMTTALLRIMA